MCVDHPAHQVVMLLQSSFHGIRRRLPQCSRTHDVCQTKSENPARSGPVNLSTAASVTLGTASPESEIPTSRPSLRPPQNRPVPANPAGQGAAARVWLSSSAFAAEWRKARRTRPASPGPPATPRPAGSCRQRPVAAASSQSGAPRPQQKPGVRVKGSRQGHCCPPQRPRQLSSTPLRVARRAIGVPGAAYGRARVARTGWRRRPYSSLAKPRGLQNEVANSSPRRIQAGLGGSPSSRPLGTRSRMP